MQTSSRLTKRAVAQADGPINAFLLWDPEAEKQTPFPVMRQYVEVHGGHMAPVGMRVTYASLEEDLAATLPSSW